MAETIKVSEGNRGMRARQGMLGAVDVPWTEDFSLDEAHFRRLIRELQKLGAHQLYVMGTAGEGYAMSDKRFRRVVDVFVEEMKESEVGAQVGVISLSTEQVIERLGYAHDLGIRTFQISLPSWETVSDTEMLTFFETVCGQFPDSGFLHYNLARAKRILDGDDYRVILDRVPNLVASKQNTPTDRYGLPIPRIEYDIGENEHKMLEKMYDTAEEILHEMKAEVLPYTRGSIDKFGSAIHEHGTCRMGRDPKRSALNSFCQMHEVKNVFVVDGSAFPTATEKNPTLTILALSWRATDYMAEEMRKGNI